MKKREAGTSPYTQKEMGDCVWHKKSQNKPSTLVNYIED